MTAAKLRKIESFVKNYLDELNWVHTLGVRAIAQRLAKAEGANKKIVDVAALFHDIAKNKTPFSKHSDHAKEGAKICEKFLQQLNLKQDFINRVVYCVEAHSSPWAKDGPQPATIEAKVVFDADIIQQLSPFGIVKQILLHQNKEFRQLIKAGEKELTWGFQLLITRSGKKLGKQRIGYVEKFFKACLATN